MEKLIKNIKIIPDNEIQKLLDNVLSFKLVSNKLHGDLFELVFTELINKYTNLKAIHLGKEYQNDKTNENDIKIDGIEYSLKSYCNKYLQLSTTKGVNLFELLDNLNNKNKLNVETLKKDKIFMNTINKQIINLSVNDIKMEASLFLVNFNELFQHTKKIIKTKKTKHYQFLFLDKNENELFHLKYGGKTANAFQRGFWMNPEKNKKYIHTFIEWRKFDMNIKNVNKIINNII